jgi:hypothetical protein
MSLCLSRLYCQKDLGPKSKEDVKQWQSLCEEILQFLNLIDPGMTKTCAKILLQYNRAKMSLAKGDFDSGFLSRPEYLLTIKEAVVLENKANKVLTQAA